MSAWVVDTDEDGCVWIRHNGGRATLDLLDKYQVQHAEASVGYIGIMSTIPRSDPGYPAFMDAALRVVRALSVKHSANIPEESWSFAAALELVQSHQEQTAECES